MDVLRLLEAPGVDEGLKKALRDSIKVVREALHIYSKPGELVFSFNGGKDSTVVLHIIRAAIAQKKQEEAASNGGSSNEGLHNDEDNGGITLTSATGIKQHAAYSFDAELPVVYFESHHNFSEVLDFMDEEAQRYGFTIRKLPGFKAGLEQLVSEGLRGVLMGTRSTDPDGVTLQAFTPTTLNWPPCMRICPALQWSYAQVWDFLRLSGLSYCGLYDLGYTSLGSTRDSVPNPLLRVVHGPADSGGSNNGRSGESAAAAAAAAVAVGDATPSATTPIPAASPPSRPGTDAALTPAGAASAYLPAWMLRDASAERLGRNKRPWPAVQQASAEPSSPAAQSASVGHIDSSRELPVAVVIVSRGIMDGSTSAAAIDPLTVCQTLRSRYNVSVSEVGILSHNMEAIAAAVNRLRPRHAHVIVVAALTTADVALAGVKAAIDLRSAASIASSIRTNERSAAGGKAQWFGNVAVCMAEEGNCEDALAGLDLPRRSS